MRDHLRFTAPFVFVLAASCTSAGRAPSTTPSAGHTTYAIHYNEEIAAATKAVGDAQTREKTLSTGFAAYIDQLKKPNWQKVESVIDDSDEAGKSTDYADVADEAVAVRSFWDAEKNEITGRAVGGAQGRLKEANCTADVGGSIAWALNDGISKQLQKRLRARNEAFVVIERYRPSLGSQNAAILEKLADDVAEASYDVHVQMLLLRRRLDQIVADKGDVKKSLDRYVQEEADFQAEPGRTDIEKKASADRVTAANKSKSELDSAASQAEAVSKDIDKTVDAATKDYEEALRNLRAKVAEKKKAEPTKEPAREPGKS